MTDSRCLPGRLECLILRQQWEGCPLQKGKKKANRRKAPGPGFACLEQHYNHNQLAQLSPGVRGIQVSLLPFLN